MMIRIKYAAYLIVAIIGNPFYQMISFLICGKTGMMKTQEWIPGKADWWHVSLPAYLFFLLLIFLMRYMIYSKKFTSNFFNVQLNGENSFSYIFVERHVFQVFGIVTFWLLAQPMDSFIIGLIFAGSFALGIILSIITYVRIRKIKKLLVV